MGYWEEILHCEGGDTLGQVAQRRCECPIPGRGRSNCEAVNVPARVHARLEGVPARGMRIETRWSLMVHSHQNHSMILLLFSFFKQGKLEQRGYITSVPFGMLEELYHPSKRVFTVCSFPHGLLIWKIQHTQTWVKF